MESRERKRDQSPGRRKARGPSPTAADLWAESWSDSSRASAGRVLERRQQSEDGPSPGATAAERARAEFQSDGSRASAGRIPERRQQSKSWMEPSAWR
eukprot:g38664.t1